MLVARPPMKSSRSVSANRLRDESSAAKRIEDVLAFFRRDAGPAIGHANLDGGRSAIFSRRCGDANPVAAGGAVLHGVLKKILQRVLHGFPVGEDERQIRLDMFLNGDVFYMPRISRGKQAGFY